MELAWLVNQQEHHDVRLFENAEIDAILNPPSFCGYKKTINNKSSCEIKKLLFKMKTTAKTTSLIGRREHLAQYGWSLMQFLKGFKFRILRWIYVKNKDPLTNGGGASWSLVSLDFK